MESRTFLEALLPAAGHHLALGVLPMPTEKTPKPAMFMKFHTSLDSLIADAEQEQSRGRDVYVSLAKFRAPQRIASNASAIRSIVLDLDVGAKDNQYDNKKAAVSRLVTVVKEYALPMPTLVDSGGGVHAYWVFDRDLTINEWWPVAKAVKDVAKKAEFLIDRTVTADAARVIRIVGSKNIKRGSALVEVRGNHKLHNFEAFRDSVYAHTPRPSWLESAKADWMKSSNMGQKQETYDNQFISSFRQIMMLAKDDPDNSCPQIIQCATKQHVTPEPLWRAALSVAWHCNDADKAIHKISDKHPEYDYDATVAKAMSTLGPYRCETFDDLNPGLCQGCKHWGKMSSPIQLGKTIERSVGPVRIEEPVQEVVDDLERISEPLYTEIPDYPAPYFRMKGGGIGLSHPAPDGGGAVTAKLTDIDFWVAAQIRDVSDGNQVKIWLKSYHAMQGTHEFLIPNSLNNADFFRHLENQGLIFDKKAEGMVRDYVFKSLTHMQNSQRYLDAVDRFGWAPDTKSFVVGATRLHNDGSTGYAPPSKYTQPLVPAMTTKGKLSEWKAAASLYCKDHLLVMPHLTLVLAAFGAPLMKFSGREVSVISAFGRQSGTGKSTAQMVGLSAFGDPQTMFIKQNSTQKSVIERLGVMGNLPVGIDELTTMDNFTLQKFLYNISEGCTGNQANQHGGGEKVSYRSWQTMITLSSNKSLSDAVSVGDKDQFASEPLLARIMEIAVSQPRGVIDSSDARRAEVQVKTNFGQAGRMFLHYCIQNADQIETDLRELIDQMHLLPGVSSRERFHVAGFACMTYAAHILRKLKLMDPPIESWFRWYSEQVTGLVNRMNQNKALTCGEIIAEYHRFYSRNTLRVKKNMHGEFVIIEPERIMSPIMMRYETDTERMFIPAVEFKKFCLERGVNVAEVLQEAAQGTMIRGNGLVSKRFFAGATDFGPATPIRCYEFLLKA